jgi:diguanylate cyclase
MRGPDTTTPGTGGGRAFAVVGALAALAFALELHFGWGGAHTRKVVDDLGELFAAAVAGSFGLWRAFRSTGRLRLSWAFIGAGAMAWAIGEGVWSYYELVRERATPFPSLADAGFLTFPALALIGLLVRRTSAPGSHRRIRGLLDGVLVATSLFVVSWATTMGNVYAAGGDSAFSAVVSMAYPIADLLLLTLTLLVVAHARPDARQGVGALAAGFLALTIGDSGFAYLTATGQYSSGNLVDLGWVAGFLLVAYAALRPDADGDPHRAELSSRAALLLPYAPALVGMGIAIYRVRGDHEDNPSLIGAGLMMLVLMIRQMLALDENRRLTAAMRHQAFHDQLTGLANRALFQDRLTHALQLHRRSRQPLTLLLIDLDDFKGINDGLGHAAGDEALRRLAERLRASTRAGDTVARLGGDEFAILAEVGADGEQLAERVLAALDVPVSVGREEVPLRASIGVVDLAAGDPAIDADELMQRADLAMYLGKRQGKGRAVSFATLEAQVLEAQVEASKTDIPDPRTAPDLSRTADPAAPRASAAPRRGA